MPDTKRANKEGARLPQACPGKEALESPSFCGSMWLMRWHRQCVARTKTRCACWRRCNRWWGRKAGSVAAFSSPWRGVVWVRVRAVRVRVNGKRSGAAEVRSKACESV